MYVILETDSANYLKLNIAKITYCRSASENYCNYRYTYQKPNKINSLKKMTTSQQAGVINCQRRYPEHSNALHNILCAVQLL